MKIIDNIFNQNLQAFLYDKCVTANYIIGWHDSFDIELTNRPFFHSRDDMGTDILNKVSSIFEKELENYRFKHSVINCSRPGETYWLHSHPQEKVILYYPNFRWNREWGGETMFYDPKAQNLEFACEYKPNRILLFDGAIPHSVRAPTYIADQYRFTISFFYGLKE